MNVHRPLFILAIFITGIAKANSISHKPDFESPLEGRWDISMLNDGKYSPAWLEVHHSGIETLVGQFVGAGGSARPISKVYFKEGIVKFSIPPQWEKSNKDLVFEAKFQGDSLVGTIISPDGKKYSFTGTRAPRLRRDTEPVWGEQIKLFNGENVDGWHTDGKNGKNQWKADSGWLRSPESGSNIISDRKFTDFKLHIEFRYPPESNSGVYLRGRYEIQIEDSRGHEASRDLLGAIYGFITPLKMMAKPAGEWQSYDVTLIGRQVTLAINGEEVICNQEIPGITGGAIDSHEGEPGPIMMQGDHGPVDFRNILITPAL